jgi:protein ImuA
MTTPLLARKPHREKPGLSVLAEVTLTLARAHEACGPARRSFAMLVAAQVLTQSDAPVIWIAPAWLPDQPNPDGMARFAPPERFIFINAHRPEDLLWSMEEVLRSGAVPLVVADIPGLPGLTSVRRLHLAAETGAAEGTHRPLGLLLTPENGGAQGVESRWHMAPAHRSDRERWHLERRRARTDPPKAWDVLCRKGEWTLGEAQIMA